MIPLRPISHPRSIFRSRLLWLALPGLIFLLWGWLNHPDYCNGAYLSVGDHYVAIADNGPQVYLDARSYSPGRWAAPGFRYFSASPADVHLPTGNFSQAISCGATRSPDASIIWVSLAYWLLILLYLAALLPACLWWQRRKARLIAPSLTVE